MDSPSSPAWQTPRQPARAPGRSSAPARRCSLSQINIFCASGIEMSLIYTRLSMVYAAPSCRRQLSGFRNWSCHISETPSVVTPVSVSSVVAPWSIPLSNEGSVFSGLSPRPPRCADTSKLSSFFPAARSSATTCCSRSGRSEMIPSTPSANQGPHLRRVVGCPLAPP